MKKQRRSRPRFGLRSILLLTTVVAVFCGCWLRQAQTQRYACERLEEFGIPVYLDPPRWWLSWLPEAVLQFGGGHYCCSVSEVTLYISSKPAVKLSETPHRNDLLSLVAKLPSLKSLQIEDSLVDPTDFPLLSRFHSIETLMLRSSELRDTDFELLPPLRSLQTLDVTASTSLSGQFINIKRFPNLQRLYCSDTQVNDDSMREIARLAELSVLELSFANVTDSGVAAISSLQKLESICLEGTHITGVGLGDLMALENIIVSQTDLVDAGLKEIARLSNLKELDLSDCVLVTDMGMSALANHPRLNTLDASGCGGVTDSCAEALSTIESLEYLSLEDTAIRSIAAFAACPELRLLKISSSEVPLDDALRYSEHLSCQFYIEDPFREFRPNASQFGFCLTSEELTSMAGDSVGGNPEVLVLEGLKGLRAKHFENFGCDVTIVDIARSEVESNAFNYFRNWPLLNELDARRSSVSNDDMGAIGELCTLSTLRLDATNIDDEGISKIASLTDLEELSLGKTNLTPLCLKTITKLPKLTSLTLPFRPDAGSLIQLLEACRSLTEVTVVPVAAVDEFCKLDDCEIKVLAGDSLQLGDIDVTPVQLRRILELLPTDDPFFDGRAVASQKLNDEHCAVLESFTHVVKLDLSGSEITNTGIRFLSKLPDLQSLNIANTHVTAVGLRSLHANKKLSMLVCAPRTWSIDFVEALLEFKELSEFSIPFSEMPPEVAFAFASSSNANELAWFENGPEWENRFYIMEDDIDWMVGRSPFNTNSAQLTLMGSLIDDAKVAEVTASPAVEYVHVKNVCCKTEALLAKLLACRNVKQLSLTGVQLAPSDIQKLAELEHLECLSLANCELTHDHFAELSRLSKLSTLWISGDFAELDGLLSLTKLSQLRKLTLTTMCSTEKYAELQRQLGKRCEIVRSTR